MLLSIARWRFASTRREETTRGSISRCSRKPSRTCVCVFVLYCVFWFGLAVLWVFANCVYGLFCVLCVCVLCCVCRCVLLFFNPIHRGMDSLCRVILQFDCFFTCAVMSSLSSGRSSRRALCEEKRGGECISKGSPHTRRSTLPRSNPSINPRAADAR